MRACVSKHFLGRKNLGKRASFANPARIVVKHVSVGQMLMWPVGAVTGGQSTNLCSHWVGYILSDKNCTRLASSRCPLTGFLEKSLFGGNGEEGSGNFAHFGIFLSRALRPPCSSSRPGESNYHASAAAADQTVGEFRELGGERTGIVGGREGISSSPPSIGAGHFWQ